MTRTYFICALIISLDALAGVPYSSPNLTKIHKKLIIVSDGGVPALQITGDSWAQMDGMPTASLPTCNSGTNGSYQYDTTRKQYVWCDGTTWWPIAASPPVGSEFVTVTTAPLSLVVDAQTGSDSNTCTAEGAAFACASCNGALAKIPKNIRDPVDILLKRYDGGTLTCALSGFNLIQGVDGGPGSLHIRGEIGLASGLTGSVTGTAVGGSNTGGELGTNCTITAAAADLTPGQLKGYQLEITSGPGAGTLLPIINNTADTIVLSKSCSATPTSSSIYRVVDGTLMSGSTSMPRALDAGTAATNAAVIWTANNISVPRGISAYLKLSNLTIVGSGSTNAFIPSGPGRIDVVRSTMKASAGATGTGVALGPQSEVVFTDSVIGSSGATTGLALTQVASSTGATMTALSGSYVYTTATSSGTGIGIPGSLLHMTSFNTIDNRGNAATWSAITSNASNAAVNGTWLQIYCGGGASTNGFATSTASGATNIYFGHIWFDQCAKAFSLRSQSNIDTFSVSSADAGTLFDISRGAHLIYSNAYPTTGYARFLRVEDVDDYATSADVTAAGGAVMSLQSGASFGSSD